MDIEKLLKEYKETKSSEIYNKLISFIINHELTILKRNQEDKSFKPSNGDEYEENRKLVRKVREELDILKIGKSSTQHPPDNILEIRKEISENINNG